MYKYTHMHVYLRNNHIYNLYTALQKFGNALENGVLDNIGMNPF